MQAALPLAIRHGHQWFIGELAYWLHRADALEAIPPACASPFALQIAGRVPEAALQWGELQCPYEQARSLAEGTAEDQLDALAAFEELGERSAADGVRRKLRALGQRRVPRGPRPSTQSNTLGLTGRELEVLALLCEGLKNSEIASRLCRSVRTVDHHLAAVFSKIGVSSREAVAAARKLALRPET